MKIVGLHLEIERTHVDEYACVCDTLHLFTPIMELGTN